MVRRPLGQTGLAVTPIGFGAFKIGRNEGIKYAHPYALPDDAAADRLIGSVLDAGINYFDTAPAYGLSEARLGRALAGRRGDVVVSTKVGEIFANGTSRYDFTEKGTRLSVAASCAALCMPVLDIVFVHAHGDDVSILDESDVVGTLLAMKEEGTVRAIGFSGKSVAAATHALDWADVLMVEYHIDDQSHASVIAAAGAQNIGVVVKKALASGRLDPGQAIAFALAPTAVDSVVVGSLNIAHLTETLDIANRVRT